MASKTITLGRKRKRRSGGGWIRFQRLAISLLLGGALFGAYVGYESWILSSYFKVREIRTIGLQHLSLSDTEARFQSMIGQNIFQLNVSPIQNRLLSDPWVKESAVKKELPDGLVLVVTERTPAAVQIDPSGAEILLDEEGVALERGGNYPSDLPRLIRFNVKAYPQALQLARLFSDHGLFTIDLADPEDLVAQLEEGTLHFGKEDYAGRRRRFLEIENDLGRRGLYGREIDLRFSDKVIVKAGFKTARDTPKRRVVEGHL